MASPACYTCQAPLPTLRCHFCPKRFCDVNCSPTSLTGRRFDGDFICGSGCSSAFIAGVMEREARTPHKCPFEDCNKSYSLRKQLNVHINAAHKLVRHGPCPCCGLTFAARHCLVKHLKLMRQQVAEKLKSADVTAVAGDAPHRNAA